MNILEFITKNYEGTWIKSICVSDDLMKLHMRSKQERKKYIQENLTDDNIEYLFKVGDVENFIKSILDRCDKNEHSFEYSFNNEIIGNHQKLKLFIEEKVTPMCKDIEVPLDLIDKILNHRAYESLRFSIREIESI